MLAGHKLCSKSQFILDLYTAPSFEYLSSCDPFPPFSNIYRQDAREEEGED